MSGTTPIALSTADVGLLASIYTPASEWAQMLYDGTNLQVPPNLVAKVQAIDLPTARKTGLIGYAAAARFNKETGGIVVSGSAIATDRDSQAMLNGAYSMALQNSAFTTQWKVNDTTFVALTAAQIISIAVAVGSWVATCFAMEASTVAGITAGTITTNAQVDQAFAAMLPPAV